MCSRSWGKRCLFVEQWCFRGSRAFRVCLSTGQEVVFHGVLARGDFLNQRGARRPHNSATAGAYFLCQWSLTVQLPAACHATDPNLHTVAPSPWSRPPFVPRGREIVVNSAMAGCPTVLAEKLKTVTKASITLLAPATAASAMIAAGDDSSPVQLCQLGLGTKVH